MFKIKQDCTKIAFCNKYYEPQKGIICTCIIITYNVLVLCIWFKVSVTMVRQQKQHFIVLLLNNVKLYVTYFTNNTVLSYRQLQQTTCIREHNKRICCIYFTNVIYTTFSWGRCGGRCGGGGGRGSGGCQQELQRVTEISRAASELCAAALNVTPTNHRQEVTGAYLKHTNPARFPLSIAIVDNGDEVKNFVTSFFKFGDFSINHCNFIVFFSMK